MMARTVLIGVDGSSRAADAMAVAALIAPALDARPALLYAHPYRELESLLSEGEREQLVREVAEASARQARAYFGDAEPPRLELVGNRSEAAALHAAASERNVAAIVLGSSSRGAIGRVMPGGVAQRLLSGAPCPIVVAPAGFAARQPLGLGAIGAGFDASAEASDALGFAARIASANKGPLIVIAVHQRVAFGNLPVGAGQAVANVNEQLRADLSRDLDKAVNELGMGQEVTARLREGDPAAVLAEESQKLGLLVVGSRGYGPIGSVFVGSVATRLLRSSSCPVMVVPRGA
ncbi:MAG TPA: universal stress protein [Solirubrobacteraceae bacterium]|nr:universal stress protein [Solirubrobacteraceae bacterium]